jgi:hypothetical protein
MVGEAVSQIPVEKRDKINKQLRMHITENMDYQQFHSLTEDQQVAACNTFLDDINNRHLRKYKTPNIFREEGATDIEIFELNYLFLLKCKALSSRPEFAKTLLGVEQPELLEFIASASPRKLAALAKSGWLLFAPRIEPAALQAIAEDDDGTSALLSAAAYLY